MPLLLDFASRCDDRVGNRLRLTQHRDVTRIDMRRRCADLPGHRFLGVRIDHPILVGDQVP